MHPILHNDPVPSGESYRMCMDTDICGLPVNHPGDHLADHSFTDCRDSEYCVLCQYRSHHMGQHVVRPADLVAIGARQQAKRALMRSATGCLNCPVCHGAKFVRGRNSEIAPNHSKLLLLATWFPRTSNYN